MTQVALILPAFYSARAQERIEGGISGVGPRAIKLAVPVFRPISTDPKADRLTQIFNEVLWSDLEFSGNIALASRSFYPTGNFAQPADIRVEEWTKPGIEAAYVAFGSSSITGNQFRVETRLMDLKTQESIIRQAHSGEDSEQLARLLAHTFADEILMRLGFGKGVTQTRIAFVSDRSGSKEIYIMDYDGSNEHPLTAIKNAAITPAWSPDGSKIAYSAWRGSAPANIEILSLSGERFPFAQTPTVTNAIPAWSPDGASVAYSSAGPNGTDIFVADWNGRNPRRITQAPQVDTSPSWNPATGRQIAFVSRRSGSPQIHTMESDGTNVQRIVDEGGDAENPSYSPDGRQIAFAWQRSGSSNYDIYIHDIATRRNIQLTSSARSNERPTWAPDGKHIAFQSNRSGRTHIYSMLADGTKVRQLTFAGTRNEGPSWSGYVRQ